MMTLGHYLNITLATLEYELRWNIAGEREFNYRKIITPSNYYIITKTKSLLLKLNDNLFRFKLKKNGICYVIDGIDKFEMKPDKEYLLSKYQDRKNTIFGNERLLFI